MTSTERRLRARRRRAIARTLMEFAALGLLGAILGGMFWEGLNRQLDIQDAQNRAWATGE
jgi:hypothetical protein